jgi:hypothetical protein
MVTKGGTNPWILRTAIFLVGAPILFLGAIIVVALIRNNLDSGSVLVLVVLFIGLVAAITVPILLGRTMTMKLAREAPTAPEGISYEVVLRRRRAFRSRLGAVRDLDGHLLMEEGSLVMVLRGPSQHRVQYSDVRSVDATRSRLGGTFHRIVLVTVNDTFYLDLFEKGRPATMEYRDAVATQIRSRIEPHRRRVE